MELQASLAEQFREINTQDIYKQESESWTIFTIYTYYFVLTKYIVLKGA